MFIVQKDLGIIPRVLTQILDSCVNGVTLADPDLDDLPIVYANKAFVDMTGYGKEEIVGRNCRFLQGDDRDQPQLEQLRLAIRSRSPIEVTLRNYRKHGELFYNKLVIKPLFDNDGGVVYFSASNMTSPSRCAPRRKSSSSTRASNSPKSPRDRGWPRGSLVIYRRRGLSGGSGLCMRAERAILEAFRE